MIKILDTTMHKKLLIIDRDGTVIVEPPVDYQVDSLEKLSFVPGAISALAALRKLDYELVMVSNQDGLGTSSFPYEDFLAPQDKMTEILAGEGITFDKSLFDPSLPEDNSPMRKPNTGMLAEYIKDGYDFANSYVIGDRETDMQLAKNLGAIGLRLDPNAKPSLDNPHTWPAIAERIRRGVRTAQLHRATRETDITVSLDLDGSGSNIDTGLRFLDHMLDQIAHHGNMRLDIIAKGDLDVDEHHTMEDTAIVLGEALAQALGDKRGIQRYGFALPMDDCRAIVLLDFGGRIDLEWDVQFNREHVGDVPTEMFKHFFQSLCAGAKCNLYVSAKGDNDHHKAEAVFKALARALSMAKSRTPFGYDIPSSKGLL